MKFVRGMKIKLVKKLIDFQNTYWNGDLYKFLNKELTIDKVTNHMKGSRESSTTCIIAFSCNHLIPVEWVTLVDYIKPGYMKMFNTSKEEPEKEVDKIIPSDEPIPKAPYYDNGNKTVATGIGGESVTVASVSQPRDYMDYVLPTLDTHESESVPQSATAFNNDYRRQDYSQRLREMVEEQSNTTSSEMNEDEEVEIPEGM